MDILELSSVSETQVDEMLNIFVSSFASEPSFQYMFRHPTKRIEQIRWTAERKFALVHEKLNIFVAGDGKIQGFSWWIPPSQTPFASLWEQIAVGYGWAPIRCGISGFMRMLAFSSQERDIIERHTQHPTWVLDTIAVDLSKGRRGLGGKLLEPGLQLAKDNEQNCYVLTHNERNVRFYEKYGFRLISTDPLKNTDLSAYSLLYEVSP